MNQGPVKHTDEPRTGKRVACLGECMVELREEAPGHLTRGFGGDSLNTAIYLARQLDRTIGQVDYITALGDDPYSTEMLLAWQAEGVGTDLVAQVPGLLPGLYIISTDAAGERSFRYWRSTAAARRLFRIEAMTERLERLFDYDLLYLSGISIAVILPDDRHRLISLLERIRARGCKVAVDGNYRPRLWRDAEEARHWMERAWRQADVALPTFDDEAALFGDETPMATVDRLRGWGVGEVVVKSGPAPCLIASGKRVVEVSTNPVEDVVDTTAAGDSFNAGYLAARLANQEPVQAAKAGHGLAGQVICHNGAIVPLG